MSLYPQPPQIFWGDIDINIEIIDCIYVYIINIINNKRFRKYKDIEPKKIQQIIDLNKEVKFQINSKSI